MKTSLNQAKKAAVSENMFFSNSLRQLVANLSLRSQEIIFSRYGVFGGNAMTLEEIGKKYHITRERVRQIIREVLKKVREKKNDPIFLQIQEAVVLAVRTNGGIMEEKQLLSALGKGNASEEAAVSFFLQCFDSVVSSEIKGELKFSYALPDFNIESWKAVKNVAIAILKDQKKTFLFDELFEKVKADKKDLSRETFAHHMEVAEEMKQNAFGKWGVAGWKEVSPKGTREKAYLVLKESEKPLHFRDIAKKIDQYKLNKKKTHPQTVHNELIKDSNFVLVGRGIYALAEWGYKKGTVKDVIEEILGHSNKPLSREEILEKVLEVRSVKKSTIVFNLNNYFSKSNSGAYSIKK
jgi:DNA-directed RNA polymerase delta subunit